MFGQNPTLFDGLPVPKGFDLPNPLDPPAGAKDNKTLDIPLPPKTDLVSFTEVYVIWQPWQGCPRCASDMASKKVDLPEEGDYRCPHVTKNEHKFIKDRHLRGELIVTREEFFTLQNGASCVSLSWLEKDPTKRKK